MAVRVTVAGHVAVEVDGASVDLSALGRLGRLFWAYLVCERHRPVSKDELAEVLWGDGELPRSWEQMLRGNASKLRAALAVAGDTGIEVASVFGAYQIRLPADAVVDAEEAGTRVEAALGALTNGSPEEARRAAAAAAAVAARGFLPGWSGVWVERRQAELRELRLRALELVAEACGVLGQWVEAAAAATEAIDAEPFRESAYQLLIAAHRGAGNPAEALRAYERCRRVLAEELGVAPSPVTESAYLSLLTDDVAEEPPAGPAAQPPLPAPLAPTAATFLVGRESESDRLRLALERAPVEGRQVVVVGGEPGIGKTTLVAAFAREAHAGGAIVLYGRCDEELDVAYRPFAEALRHYVAACPQAELAAHVAAHDSELSRIVPDLSRRLPGVALPPVSGSAGDRYRLFEAVTALLGQAAQRRPVVLVLDDLHWAPAPTLALLRHVLAARTPSLVVVGTYRHTEVTPDHLLAATLADLRREPGVERILLHGLDEEGVTAFVERTEGHPLDAAGTAMAHGLYSRTGGNPFFVGEFMRHLAESGAVYRKAGGWSYYEDAEGLGLPEGVRDVVARRLARLSDDANRVLTVASVVGFQFDLLLLEAVVDGRHPDATLDALDEAMRSSLIAEVGTGQYQFAHALVRDTIYSALTATRRARLHLHVGRALATLPGDPDPRLPALAHHFVEARAVGGATEAGGYALAAGRQAFARGAWEDVVAFVGLGLATLSTSDPEHLEARFELLLLGFETRGLMVADQPPGTLLEAAETARRLGSPDRLARAVSLYLFSDGPTDLRGVELAEDALVALGQSSPALRARVLASMTLAPSVIAAGDAEVRADAALALARQAGDVEALHAALFARAMLLTDTPRARELLDVEEELFALGPMPGPVTGPRWRNGVGRGRTIACLMVGDRDGFERGIGELERRNLSIRNPGVAFQAALLRTALALLDGRFDEVEALVAIEGAIPARPEILSDPMAVQLCKLAIERGTIADHKADVVRVGDMRPNNVGLMSMLAFVHAETGDHDAARAIVAHLAADGFVRVRRSMAATGFAYLAEVAAALDDRHLSAGVLEVFRPYSGLVVASGLVAHCPGAVDRYLGQLCAVLGRCDDAAAYYEAALLVEDGLRSPPLLARTGYWFGRMLLGRRGPGDAVRARSLLQAARGTADALGMAGLGAQAAELL